MPTNIRILFSIATLSFSGTVFALLPPPEQPRPRVTACINYETSKSALTNDSAKVMSNVVKLMNRVPEEFYNFAIVYNYHPNHPQSSSNPISNPLFVKLAYERQQTFFDALRIHNTAGSKLDTVGLSIGIENTVIKFVEPCEAFVQIVYPHGAEKYLCEHAPKNCKPVKCNADGCSENGG